MRVVTIDFETYWSKTHSLSKIPALTYVMHPDTEVISMAIKEDSGDAQVVFGEAAIAQHLSAQDFSDAMLVAHNMSGFDAMILAWRFGVTPKIWACTLAMARPIHAKTTGLALGKLVEHYGIGVKDNTVLIATQGRRLCDFTPQERVDMERYNKEDTDQCYALFNALLPNYTSKELWQIDATIRMLVESRFTLNRYLLETALRDERQRKQDSIMQLAKALQATPKASLAIQIATPDTIEEAVRAELASAPKFGALLRSFDVEVPMKPSPTNPEKLVPALAKTDSAFLALQEHDNPLVAAAARTRLDVKSSLLETRLEAFIAAGKATRGKLPIPLHYCGADTTGRWSGWMFNPQNLPRINPAAPKLSDALRNSIRAPKGYKIVVADLSGIELRVNHFLWKVPSSMALFRASPDKADLYKDFAAMLYNVPLEDVSKIQRQIGKVAHLGLGFGSGAATFQKVAKIMGGVDLTPEECADIVSRWRDAYREIVQGWKYCHAMLPMVAGGSRTTVDPWGLVTTCKGGLKLPNGRLVRYPALRTEPTAEGRDEWVYGEGRHKTRIYAGKIDENIVQALARDIIADVAFLAYRETKLRPSLTVHDELVYVAPENEAADILDCVQRIMRTPPAWWPELVTWSEGDIADTYGSAK